MYTIHAGALETITIDGVYGSFTTNADGTVNHSLPLGELTLHGSVSGNSFTRTITKDTTDVKVMPEGLVVFWYGYNGKDIYFTDEVRQVYSSGSGSITLKKYTNYFSISNSNLSIGLRRTNIPINHSLYNKVNLIGYNTRGITDDIILEGHDDWSTTSKYYIQTIPIASSPIKYSVDISEVSGETYPYFRQTHQYTSYCYALWFEP